MMDFVSFLNFASALVLEILWFWYCELCVDQLNCTEVILVMVVILVSKLVLFHFEFWSQFIWAFGEPLTRSSGVIIIRLGGACAIVSGLLTLQWVSTPSEHNSEQWICRAMENGRETNFASLRLKFSRLSASEFQFRPNKRPSESEPVSKQTNIQRKERMSVKEQTNDVRE